MLVFVAGILSLRASLLIGEELTVKVGLITPLSGNYQEFGNGLKSAALLAQSFIKRDAKRKYKIDVIVEDGGYQPAEAKRAFEKFRDTEKVHYIVGPFNFGQTMTLGPLADAAKIVLLANNSKAPEIAKAGEYVFRVTYNAADENQFLASAIADHMKGEALYIIGPKSPSTDDTVSRIRLVLQEKGKRIGGVERYSLGAGDMRPELLRIRREKPADILLLGTSNEVGIMLRHGAELKLTAQYYSALVNQYELLAVAKQYGEKLLFSTPSTEEKRSLLGKEFDEEFERSFGRKPFFEAASTFDALILLGDCLEKEGDQVESVKKCLYDTKNFHGASGAFSFDANGDAKRDWFFSKVNNFEP